MARSHDFNDFVELPHRNKNSDRHRRLFWSILGSNPIDPKRLGIHLEQPLLLQTTPHHHNFTTQNGPGEIPSTYPFLSVPGGCGGALEPIRGVVGLGPPLAVLTLISLPAGNATSASEQASRHGRLARHHGLAPGRWIAGRACNDSF
jgi:hypothetical protein